MNQHLLTRRKFLMSLVKQKDYFKTEAIETGTFTFTMTSVLNTDCVTYISYSVNNGRTWVRTDNVNSQEVTVTTPTISAGDSVLWKADAVQYQMRDSKGYGRFSSTGKFNVKGNILSLLYSDNFADKTTLKSYVNGSSSSTGHGAFANLLHSSKVVSASDLILPCSSLLYGCYFGLFHNCTSLTTPPVLPATTLAAYCYDEMFYGCSALTTAPLLPATKVTAAAYRRMFYGCSSLTTASALPATTLAGSCYTYMFQNCTSLTTAPALPATTLASNCYSSMFSGCRSLTTAPVLPATTLVSSCYQSMFYNCKALTTAPELPATTLVSNCYYQMFRNCSNLNYIKAMFTTTPSTSYTRSWVSGVASSGTFVKNTAATWSVSGVNGVPSNWTIQTASS